MLYLNTCQSPAAAAAEDDVKTYNTWNERGGDFFHHSNLQDSIWSVPKETNTTAFKSFSWTDCTFSAAAVNCD
jgi:hypothetical protein